MRLVLLALMILTGLPGRSAVTVFVSAPTREGFVDADRGILDSVDDVQKQLKGTKKVDLVDDREKADVVVTVVARGQGSEAFGQRLTHHQYYKGAIVETRPIMQNTRWVAAVLEVGSYRKEFVGSYTAEIVLWKKCASRLASEVKAWVEANADQIRRQGSTAR